MPESDEPLRKVTLNLYRSDVEWLERNYPQGWTSTIREWVRERKNLREAFRKNQKRTSFDGQ